MCFFLCFKKSLYKQLNFLVYFLSEVRFFSKNLDVNHTLSQMSDFFTTILFNCLCCFEFRTRSGSTILTHSQRFDTFISVSVYLLECSQAI